MNNLDDDLRSLIAPQYVSSGGGPMVELPDAHPADDVAWQQFLAASAMTSAGIVGFLKDAIDDFFIRSYQNILQTHYPTAELACATPWAEAEVLIRRYEVTGGLDPRVRREMFEQHCLRLSGDLDAT